MSLYNLFIGAENNLGTPNLYFNGNVRFVSGGNDLTDSQEATFRNAVYNMQLSMSRA